MRTFTALPGVLRTEQEVDEHFQGDGPRSYNAEACIAEVTPMLLAVQQFLIEHGVPHVIGILAHEEVRESETTGRTFLASWLPDAESMKAYHAAQVLLAHGPSNLFVTQANSTEGTIIKTMMDRGPASN